MKKLLIFLVVLISFADAQDLQKVSLQLKWKYQFQFAGFIAAYEKGFYKDVGLDVELKEFQTHINIVQDIVTQKTDFGISDSALVYNRLKEKPVTALMAVFQHSPFMLLGLKDKGINILDDLNNKVIALHEGIDGVSIKAMLKTKNIQYLSHKPIFSLDKLMSREVDMMSSYISNEPYTAKILGLDIQTFSPKDYGFEGYGDILFTSKKLIEKNPALVKKFYDASLKGWRYAYSNIDEVVDIIYEKYNTLDKSKQALQYEANTLKTLSGYKKNLGELNIEKVKSIAQQFNLVKNEHNKLDVLDDFVYKLNNETVKMKEVNVMLVFDKPPFIFGQLSGKGIESDLLKEAFSLVNYKVIISQGKKSEQETVLYEENRIDAVASISEKDDGLFYSDPFTVYENYVVTRKNDNIKMDSLKDLKNIKFVTWKRAYNDLGKEFYNLFNPINGKYKESYHDTSTQINDAKMFFSKKVDAIIVDKTIFNWHKLFFKNNEDFEFHRVLNTLKTYPVTFRNKKIRDDFNKGLRILKQNGRYSEIIKFYETQDIRQLLTLTNLLSDISGKYIFESRKKDLKNILKRFFIHPDIEVISIKNKKGLYLKLVKHNNKIIEDKLFNTINLQNVESKIYYKTEFDLFSLGELSLYYKKDYKTKNGRVIPFLKEFNELQKDDYSFLKKSYKKLKIENVSSLFLTKKEREYLLKHKTITVHNESEWAPYNYNRNGIAQGFSIDYISLIAKKLNINIKFIHGYEWNEYLDLIKKEKIDIITNISKNEKREKYINFTTSYIESKKAIFSNIPNVKSISDLKGKTVALPSQFYTQNYLEKNYPSIKIKTYKNTKDSLYAVINKDADAIIENFAVVNSLLKQNGLSLPFVTLNDDFELRSKLHIGVRKSQVLLRDIIEKAKNTITEEEFIKLENKWFGIKNKNKSLFTQKELEYIKTKKTVNVCYHKEQRPWVIKIKDEIQGYSLEFLKHITQKSNLDFKMVESSSVTEHFNKIKNGSCDISPVIVTAPNKFKFLTPTSSMIEDNIVLVTRINEPYISDFSNLKDKKIAMHKGKKSLVRYVQSLYPSLNIVEIDNLDLDRVVSGEFYGYISASYKMSYNIYPQYINSLKIMSKMGDKKVKGSFGITVREPILLSIFNKSLNEISQLERQKIKNAWISVEIEKQFDYKLFIQVISIFSIIFLILFISYFKQKKLHEKIKRLNENLEESIRIEVQKNREKDKVMLSQSRLAQMGEMISMIAHQWRQPLNSLSLLNQTVLLKYDRDKLNQESIEFFRVHSKKQIQEMSKTIDDFKNFFKPEKVKKEFLINDMMYDLLDIIKPIFVSNNIHISVDIENKYFIEGYQNELGQAILNILNNSKDALIENNIENRSVIITIKELDKKIYIVISDNAQGVPLEIIDHIFDPYFSTKDEKQGTGLGLYMTKMIIEEHMSGEVKVENGKHGAIFTVILKKRFTK